MGSFKSGSLTAKQIICELEDRSDEKIARKSMDRKHRKLYETEKTMPKELTYLNTEFQRKKQPVTTL